MAGRGALVLVAGCLLLLAVACGGGSAAESGARRQAADGGSYTSVSPAELASMLQHKDFVLVNVHVPPDQDIAGTDAWVPFNDTDGLLRRLPDRGARVIVYCSSGHMSDTAARALVRAGYTDVWDLSGGLQAWQAAGFPVQPHGATPIAIQ